MEATAIRHTIDGKRGILTEGSLVFISDGRSPTYQAFIEKFERSEKVVVRTLKGRFIEGIPLHRVHF